MASHFMIKRGALLLKASGAINVGMTRVMTKSSGKVEIRLNPDEAIVLFELLSRWCDQDATDSPSGACFESPAECAMLHSLLTELERQLVAPFKPDYGRTLDDARNRVAELWDYPTLKS